jgi:6-pyruvoyltetrahydropterin/6-carboxytetrahydropterin synthase
MLYCTRRLTFCAGHRVLNHESKCAFPHGHNYVAEIAVSGPLDDVGRVIDFSVVKTVVGRWIDDNWDHAFLIYTEDRELLDAFRQVPTWRVFPMKYNPTAENIARVLLTVAGELLRPNGVRVEHVRIHETENCYADAVPD